MWNSVSVEKTQVAGCGKPGSLSLVLWELRRKISTNLHKLSILKFQRWNWRHHHSFKLGQISHALSFTNGRTNLKWMSLRKCKWFKLSLLKTNMFYYFCPLVLKSTPSKISRNDFLRTDYNCAEIFISSVKSHKLSFSSLQ